jgi:hypothetical protein
LSEEHVIVVEVDGPTVVVDEGASVVIEVDTNAVEVLFEEHLTELVVVESGDTLVVVVEGAQGAPGIGEGTAGTMDVGNDPSVVIDLSQRKKCYRCTLDDNTPISFTGGAPYLDGNTFLLQITQGAPGGWVPIWSPGFHFSQDIPQVLLSVEAGKSDYIGFIYRHAAGKCDVLGFTRSF